MTMTVDSSTDGSRTSNSAGRLRIGWRRLLEKQRNRMPASWSGSERGTLCCGQSRRMGWAVQVPRAAEPCPGSDRRRSGRNREWNGRLDDASDWWAAGESPSRSGSERWDCGGARCSGCDGRTPSCRLLDRLSNWWDGPCIRAGRSTSSRSPLNWHNKQTISFDDRNIKINWLSKFYLVFAVVVKIVILVDDGQFAAFGPAEGDVHGSSRRAIARCSGHGRERNDVLWPVDMVFL